MSKCDWQKIRSQGEQIQAFTWTNEKVEGRTKLIEDEDGSWTCEKCQEIWLLEAGTPKENNYNYCPNCGRKIEEYVRYEEPEWWEER